MILEQFEIDSIILLSNTLKQEEIATQYNVSKSTIGRILRSNNIKCQRNRLNESRLKFNLEYFDNLDEIKAYWLGFICADGCLKNNKITLVSKDLSVIEKFKNYLESEHSITKRETYDKRTLKYYISYSISITNNIFTKKIQKYINIEKSDNFSMKNIDEKLIKYFIAGLFDGDGCVYVKKNKTYISLISTLECLTQIQNYLLNNVDIKKTKIIRKTKNKNNWILYLYKDANNFLNHIYDDNFKNLYLERKFKHKKNEN